MISENYLIITTKIVFLKQFTQKKKKFVKIYTIKAEYLIEFCPNFFLNITIARHCYISC